MVIGPNLIQGTGDRCGTQGRVLKKGTGAGRLKVGCWGMKEGQCGRKAAGWLGGCVALCRRACMVAGRKRGWRGGRSVNIRCGMAKFRVVLDMVIVDQLRHIFARQVGRLSGLGVICDLWHTGPAVCIHKGVRITQRRHTWIVSRPWWSLQDGWSPNTARKVAAVRLLVLEQHL
jgi:hypothetical protein